MVQEEEDEMFSGITEQQWVLDGRGKASICRGRKFPSTLLGSVGSLRIKLTYDR